ncbi:MAG: hypothetical protein J6Z36_01580, partial [Clostridia bacterium]|nr:hypothetical protein [Clostridia bacterium]
MKRKKKLIAILSAVVFFGALLLGTNAVFSVSKIDADFTLLSKEANTDAQAVQKALEERYSGDVIF